VVNSYILIKGQSTMPIEIKDCDGGVGNVIVLYGVETDQELLKVL
jgi:hypothetical protein